MELKDSLLYDGVKFVFNACADIEDVAERLEKSGDCPGIMEASAKRTIQPNGTAVYEFRSRRE